MKNNDSDFIIQNGFVNEFDSSDDHRRLYSSMFSKALISTEKMVEYNFSSNRTYNGVKNKNNENFYDTKSNILAFCGGRGYGKTSSVLNFIKILENIDSKDDYYSDLIGENKSKVYENTKFHKLDLIDPTLISDNESILEMVVSKIYGQIKDNLKKTDDYELQGKVMKLLKETYKNIKTINEKKEDRLKKEIYSENILETIERLDSSANIRNNIKNMVDLYFEIINSDNRSRENKNNVLIIPIDDIDMNLENAIELIEEIRRYLILPNVLILLAFDEKQMLDIIKENFLKKYSDKKDTSSRIDIHCYELANNYLLKLIPPDNRLYTPNLSELFLTSKVKFREESKEPVDSTKYLINKIYDKTRLLLIPNGYGVHSNEYLFSN